MWKTKQRKRAKAKIRHELKWAPFYNLFRKHKTQILTKESNRTSLSFWTSFEERYLYSSHMVGFKMFNAICEDI